MENDNLISANVWLAGRSYRIRIKPEEEEAVRKAIKLADDKITDLRNHYAGKDDQDFVAMCLLTYAADGATEGNTFNPLLDSDIKSMITKIDNIT
ncbi:MAG: cell division protein ZapA [Flavipsychrobacter sp.]|nr:cell division protein ZapA [Flavipsychrobacter sp.]